MNANSIINKLRSSGLLESDELQRVIDLMTQNKKYGLVWEDHPEGVDLELKDGVFNIKDVKERRIYEDEDGRENLLFEGDNLHSLMLMKDAGVTVDGIYIDPPYNTGVEFTYDDSRVGMDDDYRHSKWLSFMEKRLKIARGLLADDGVIFVSIDDNEQANLKLLMDEVFGYDNFRSNIVWQSTIGSNTGDDIINITEYILVYSKSDNYNLKRLPFINDGKMKLKDSHFKRRGYYAIDKLDSKRQSSHYSESLNYPIIIDGEELYPGGSNVRQDHWNWMWSKDKVEWGLQNDFIHIKTNKDGSKTVYNKRYEYVDNQDRLFNRGSVFKNLILSKEFQTSDGTKELSNIFGESYIFDYPKPSGLIRKLLSIIKDDAVILDFFAGSGTTGHAVMELNQEDGGNRRFILCTNNENNIAVDVTYERLRRVITGDWASGQRKGLSNNLSYYQVDIDSNDLMQYDEKLKRNAYNELLRRVIRDELVIELHTDNYVKLSDYNNQSILFILSNIITDDIRCIDLSIYDKIYTHYVTSRDVLFEYLGGTVVEFY